MNIPVLHVTERTLAEAYEKALIGLYKEGIRIKTQYDKPGDPLSIDSTMNITILEPETDPMIHMAFPVGIYLSWPAGCLWFLEGTSYPFRQGEFLYCRVYG